MAGGLLQLVASSESTQDVYLTGNPEITFFKVVFRRHTNFATESIELNWQGSDNLNGRVSCIIPLLGDLLDKLYLNMTMRVTSSKKNGIISCIYNPTHTVIDTVTLNIGGYEIDRHTGNWLEIYSELTENNNIGAMGDITTNQGTKYQILTKSGSNVYYFDEDSPNPIVIDNNTITTSKKFDAYVPLKFWFCKNTGLALPLISLRVSEIEIILNINKECLLENSINNSGIELLSNTLWGNFVFLDKEERKRFATSAHEYLIDQLNYREIVTSGNSLNLNFLNHPVKEIIWTSNINKVNGYFNQLPGGFYSNNEPDNYFENDIKYNILLNNSSRFTPRPLEYFTQQQIYEYHTGTPIQLSSECIKTGFSIGNSYQNNIAVYSFALKPEEMQPSGTCNFTRIEDCELVINNYGINIPETYNVFAINYNVFRICNGMGSILYSN